MKKTLLLIAVVLTLVVGPGRADSNRLGSIRAARVQNVEAAEGNSLNFDAAGNTDVTASGSDLSRNTGRPDSISFAQLDRSPRALSPSPMWIFAVLGLGVLAWRLLGLHRAKEMADHEHQTHHARTEMYRVLAQARLQD